MPYSNPQNSPSLNKLLSLKNKSVLVIGGRKDYLDQRLVSFSQNWVQNYCSK